MNASLAAKIELCPGSALQKRVDARRVAGVLPLGTVNSEREGLLPPVAGRREGGPALGRSRFDCKAGWPGSAEG